MARKIKSNSEFDGYIVATGYISGANILGDGSQLINLPSADLSAYTLQTTTNTISGDLDTLEIAVGLNTAKTGITAQQTQDIIDNLSDITLLQSQTTTISGDLDTLEATVTGLGTDYVNITGDTMTGDLTVGGNTTVNGTLTIDGDIIQISGSNTTQIAETLIVEDNLIILNSGELGAGVLAGEAGIEIDRGTEDNYKFIFRESDDVFAVGVSGSEQAVATREDAPIDNAFAIWNDTTKSFETNALYTASTTIAKFTDSTVGDNSTNPITITHNLGTKDVTYSIMDNSTDEIIDAEVTLPTINTLVVEFTNAPTTNQYKVTVIG